MNKVARLGLGTLVLAFASIALAARADEPPLRATEPVPDPGKSIVGDDDSSAIATNPANLAFLPAPELRWNYVHTGDASPLPARGHSLALAAPFWNLATGVRLDLIDPPSAAPAPFTTDYHWFRWALAARAGNSVAIGSTLGWSFSDSPALDRLFSITSGLTVRPIPWVSLAFEARDWNEPENVFRERVGRSWIWGLGLRPFETRAFEIDGEVAYYEENKTLRPRFVAGLDVPRVGRLRGELRVDDPNGSPLDVLATAGLDIDFDVLQVSGGGIFGGSVGKSGAGFYAGAALRGFREPGMKLPARVVKIRFDSTPGVRGHVHLLRHLWRLADDPEVDGVVFVMKAEPASSLAHAEELGDAIRMIKSRGKKVLCHLEDAGSRALYACAQADRIVMNPAGGLRFAGVSSSYYYLGGLLKKLDVKADFVRIGDHKLAAEQLTEEKGSAVAQKDHQELVDEFNKLYMHDVGGGRRIAMADLEKRIAKGPFIAHEARDAGLIDSLAYEDEIDRVLAEMFGRRVHVSDDSFLPRAPKRWSDAPKIALIYLSGDMVDGESQHIPLIGIELAGSRTLEKALKRAKDDPSVKAIVFRMETGGGSSLAADVMLHEAQRAAKAKPFIVSMGTVAASGGYYASMAGKPIFANPATTTGSIGIFYGKVDVSGLLEKLGVHFDMYRSAPRADAESLFRPFTDDERAELGHKVKQFYDTFIARVHEGRPKLTVEQIDALARGKVWSGQQAYDRGLVDKLGGLREALAEARRQAHLADDAPIVELPEEDDSLLGFVLKLVGIKAAGISIGPAALLIPPAMIDAARALAPFFVFEPEKALALSELVEEMPAVDDDRFPAEP